MELLLNFIWLAISLALGWLLFASRRGHAAVSRQPIRSTSTAWVSYLLLVALLLPAISMTDDLMAMAAPADGEQIVRRLEVSTACQHRLNLNVALFHPTRHDFDFSLASMGDIDPTPSYRAFSSPQRRSLRVRAPPFAV